MDPAQGDGNLTEAGPEAAAQAVIGWRYWQFQPATGRLRSVSHPAIEWLPGQPLVAVCLIGGHPAPAKGCACGIYASRDLGTLLEHGLCFSPDVPLVVGSVSLWGTLVADPDGWRGQYAYPVHLSVVTGVETDLAGQPAGVARLSAYRVPVDTVPPASALGDISAALLSFQAMSGPAPRA